MGALVKSISRTSPLLFLGLAILAVPCTVSANGEKRALPSHVPPERSSQVHDGFGINSDLPRDPYLPWNRRWWTRMFDAGFKWIRIGQYENSSDWTSWEWVEQKRGVFAVPQQVEDYVDSLVDNGVLVQVHLLYGNAMYTSPAGKLPEVSGPAPGSSHNPDRSLYSVFWPPTTPEQIAAFDRYVAWMVQHFRGRISYWALWNEQDIDYWNPVANPEEYGRLLNSFVQTVHETNLEARVIYGGQADPSRDFTQRALDACQCGIIVERQIRDSSIDPASGCWQKIARLPATVAEYTDSNAPRGKALGYCVRAFNDAGESAYSNVVRIHW